MAKHLKRQLRNAKKKNKNKNKARIEYLTVTRTNE